VSKADELLQINAKFKVRIFFAKETRNEMEESNNFKLFTKHFVGDVNSVEC
jgi:hypothetical protein